MTTYKFTDASNAVVHVIDADGVSRMSMAVESMPAGSAVLPADPVAAGPGVIRDWQFRDRFTQAQLVGVMRAAMAGDDIAAAVWLKLSTASDGVDLDAVANQHGVGYIAQAYPALGIDPAMILA